MESKEASTGNAEVEQEDADNPDQIDSDAERPDDIPELELGLTQRILSEICLMAS